MQRPAGRRCGLATKNGDHLGWHGQGVRESPRVGLLVSEAAIAEVAAIVSGELNCEAYLDRVHAHVWRGTNGVALRLHRELLRELRARTFPLGCT